MGAVADNKKQAVRRLAVQVALVIIGLTMYAFGVAMFVLPLDMIAAGTTGLALVAEHYWGIPLTVFIAAFNIAMFIWGFLEMGKEFALSTLVATFYFPFILDQAILIVGDFVFTSDPMLCAIFAGLIIGFSLGIVIKSGASTGGTDIPPIALKKRFGIPISVTMYTLDFAALMFQLTFRDKEKILYALVMVMVYTVVLDKVLLMGIKQVQLQIISSKYEEISRLIQEKLQRGTTLLKIEGGHSHKDSMAVLAVVSGRELTKVKNLVTDVDDDAFMIVSQVGEVRGRGFTKPKNFTD